MRGRAKRPGKADQVTEDSTPVRTPGAETPWGTGLTVAAFIAAVTAAAIIVLSLGLTRLHPLLAVGLNIVAEIGRAHV